MRDKSQNRIEDRGARSECQTPFCPRSSLLAPRSCRAALTLIELLVVIIILTTVVAAAIPILSPANDNRRVREAGRGLNTFITGAQSRAVSLNRPFGIALKRLAQDNDKDGNPLNPHEDAGACVEVFYVEQLPPYSGFDANSRVCVALHPEPTMAGTVLVRFMARGLTGPGMPRGWQRDQFPTATIRPGDVIEVGGTRYEMLPEDSDPGNYTQIEFDDLGYFKDPGGAAAPTILARPVNDSGQQLNVKYDDDGLELEKRSYAIDGDANKPFWTSPMTYRILRQATPTSDEPYQLPEGVAIDLRASGVGNYDYFYWLNVNDNSLGAIIMFTPEGRVSRVSYSEAPYVSTNDPRAFDQPVTDNVYLLLGKRENVPAPLADNDPTLSVASWTAATTDEKRAELKQGINWLSGDATWIIIGSQTGRIATVENAAVDPLTVLNDPRPLVMASEETEEMRARQIIAAREFTRETSQLGGR